MAASLRYLTVQDILWVNLQVTRRVNPYNYARLEEATYYQYAYGDSDEPVKQAERFLRGFRKQAPIEHGNDATAVVAAFAFLSLNGYEIIGEDGAIASQLGSSTELGSLVRKSEHHHPPTVREAVTDVILRLPKTVQAFGGSPVEIIADGAIH